MQIEIKGIKQIQKKMKQIGKDVKKSKKPIKESVDWVLRDIETNWRKEGALFGGWNPLAPSTREDRQSKGFPPARPILQRTGQLKKGTQVKKLTDKEAIIDNPVEYFKYHQLGTGKIPQRKILDLRKEAVDAIEEIFTNWIQGILEK